jgi:hypothetical protein
VLDYSNIIILLWPNNPSISTPLQIEQSQDFSISSTLQFNNAQSFAVIEQWSIETCLNSICSIREQFESSSSLQTTLSELFVPSNTLKYGIYQMTLTVKMINSPQLITSSIIYVKIIPSPIQVQLIQFDPSIIIQGNQQTLILNPGRFSIDPDESYFNSTVNFLYSNLNLLFISLKNWNYSYYCQIYNNSNTNETMLPTDNTTINSLVLSCFGNSTS